MGRHTVQRPFRSSALGIALVTGAGALGLLGRPRPLGDRRRRRPGGHHRRRRVPVRRQGKDIWESFEKLGIPVGKVLTSQCCRAWETADLAFDRHEEVADLSVLPVEDTGGTSPP